MGASVKITGATETETLVNQLRWLAGWSGKMLRGMRMMYNVIENVRRLHVYGSDSSGCDKSMLEATLDEIAVLLDGPATEMRHKFQLHEIAANDSVPLHVALEKDIKQIQDICDGRLPVPVDDPMECACPILPSEESTKEFEFIVEQMCGNAGKIQKILKDQGLKSHFVLNMTTVDDHGRPVKINEFDLEKIVNDFNLKCLEAKESALAAKEGADNAVQPSTPA